MNRLILHANGPLNPITPTIIFIEYDGKPSLPIGEASSIVEASILINSHFRCLIPGESECPERYVCFARNGSGDYIEVAATSF